MCGRCPHAPRPSGPRRIELARGCRGGGPAAGGGYAAVCVAAVCIAAVATVCAAAPCVAGVASTNKGVCVAVAAVLGRPGQPSL